MSEPLIDRDLFAAYLNLARHNAFLLLEDIAKQNGLSEGEREEDHLTNHPVLNKLEQEKHPRRQQKILASLNKAVPFIQRLQRHLIASQRKQATPASADVKNNKPAFEDQADTLLPKHYHELLKDLLLETLHQQRNCHTHAYHSLKQPLEKLIPFLYVLFDAAVRTIKSRLQLNEPDIAHLRRKAAHKPKPADKGKLVTNPKFRYTLTTSDGYFSATGLAFFACLFLSKQDGWQLLKQISGFKNDNTKRHKATLEVFTCWRVRLPAERLDSQTDRQSLMLDMLGELIRCPQKLYQHLGAQDKRDFVMETDVDEALDETLDEVPEVLLTRQGERFVPLMMSYFDQAEAFPLRFQLDLGNLCFASYPKTLPGDDEPAVRRLMHKVLVFGRLPALAKAPKSQSWQALERDPATISDDYDQPYISQTTPHYHLLDDNIALKLVSNKILDDHNDSYPQIKPDTKHPARYEPPPNRRADFYLSRHAFWQLGFYYLLQLSHHQQLHIMPNLEELLKSYKDAINKIFQDVQSGALAPLADNAALQRALETYQYGRNRAHLQVKNLPQVVQHYLLSRQKQGDALESAKRTLKAYLADNERRLKLLKRLVDTNDRRNLAGAKKQKVVKAGNMADFLAKDLLRLQPIQNADAANKGKATSLIVAELQACLAFFARDKHRLPALFASMGLLGGEQPHPFLARVGLDHAGVIGFYRAYLEARAKYLDGLKTTIKANPARIADFPYLRKPVRPPADIQAHIKTLQEQPINLPRQLFFPFIKSALIALGGPLQQAIEGAQRCNASYLLALYYQHFRQDHAQRYYACPRHYDLLDKVYAHEQKSQAKPQQIKTMQWRYASAEGRKMVSNIKAYLRSSAEKRAGATKHKSTSPDNRFAEYQQLSQNEKDIRELAVQDQVLFLAAQQLAQHEQVEAVQKLKLQNLVRDALNVSIAYALPLHGKKIVSQHIKLKKIGEFRRFLKDRRLPALLPYYPQQEIERIDLEHELQDYQQRRLEVFRRIHAFERWVHERYGLDAEQDKDSEHGRLLRAYFKAHPAADSKQKMQQMLVLRNAFSHNQYPSGKEMYPLAEAMLQEASEHFKTQRGPLRVAEYFAKKLLELYPERG